MVLIRNRQVDKRGMFYVGQDGAVLAELVYHIGPKGELVIDHTEVDDSLSGKGIGEQLVETAVEYARTHQMKIRVLCPFAKKIFSKRPDWNELLL
jgi:predicted GNAT family acetyltransferase